jgi:hypothetical protein
MSAQVINTFRNYFKVTKPLATPLPMRALLQAITRRTKRRTTKKRRNPPKIMTMILAKTPHFQILHLLLRLHLAVARRRIPQLLFRRRMSRGVLTITIVMQCKALSRNCRMPAITEAGRFSRAQMRIRAGFGDDFIRRSINANPGEFGGCRHVHQKEY